MAPGNDRQEADRRQEPRIHCCEEIDFSVEGKSYVGIVRDFSTGGFLIETKDAFAVGQGVHIEYFSPAENKTITMNGEIARLTSRGIGIHLLP